MPRHLFQAVTSQTSNYTATLADSLILCNGTFTVTLPDLAGELTGRRYSIKNIGTGTITITGTDNIEDETSITISNEENAELIHDGSNWRIV